MRCEMLMTAGNEALRNELLLGRLFINIQLVLIHPIGGPSEISNGFLERVLQLHHVLHL